MIDPPSVVGPLVRRLYADPSTSRRQREVWPGASGREVLGTSSGAVSGAKAFT
jgi:hypothetical protein